MCNIDDGGTTAVHDATLMKSLGRGSMMTGSSMSRGGGISSSSSSSMRGRGGSISAGRGIATSTIGIVTSSSTSVGRGVPLSQGRGRGALSIGRGRGGGPVLTRTSLAQQQQQSSDEEEGDDEEEEEEIEAEENEAEETDEEEEESESEEVATSEMTQKLSLVDQATSSPSSPSSPLDEAAEAEEEAADSRFVQLIPSPLAQSLLDRLTDTSFMYSFIADKQFPIVDYTGHDDLIFKFDVPSPDDLAFSARDQSKISHKAENAKFKPIVKQQSSSGAAVSGSSGSASGKQQKTGKSNLSVDVTASDDAANKGTSKQQEPTTPVTPFSMKPKGPPPKDEIKKRINVVIIGHVDAGKSTLMGHLLVQTGMVSDKQMHKFKKESQEKGKGSFAFAWVLDEHSEERDRGVTIDVGVRYFETPNRHVTILDAPGHRDFIPNMITGASQADMAILVVDSSIGGFESGFQNGGQTKEHLILARSLGVSEVLVVVNKLDTVDWDQDRFKHISEQIGHFMKQIGYRGERDATFIPGSGLTGVNLSERVTTVAQDKKNPLAADAAKLAEWYKGPSIIEHIDQFTAANREVDKPFRMSINDVYKTMATGVTVAGRIDSGHIPVDDQLLVVPLNQTCVVKNILRHKTSITSAFAGDNVELGLTKIDMNLLNVGSILCDPAHPIKLAKKFEARIATFEMDIPITKGAQVVIHVHNINLPAIVSRIKCTLNKHQEILKKKPRVLPSGTTAIVEVKLAEKSQTIPLERYADYPSFGRFMLRSNGKTIAAGMVTEILDSGASSTKKKSSSSSSSSSKAE